MTNLEHMGLSWLRFEKRCPVALFERNPRLGLGEPDVLGITDHRFLLEIEIKRSLSDFRADAKKPHVRERSFQLEIEFECPKSPKQFWYLVTPEILGAIEPLVPTWAGLLVGPKNDEIQQLRCVKKAPTNKASVRLSLKECVRLAHCMANQIYSDSLRLESFYRRMELNPHYNDHEAWNNFGSTLAFEV